MLRVFFLFKLNFTVYLFFVFFNANFHSGQWFPIRDERRFLVKPEMENRAFRQIQLL